MKAKRGYSEKFVGATSKEPCKVEDRHRKVFAICGMVEEALGMPVEFVPLKKASPRLRLKALSRGKRMVVRDSQLYTYLLNESLFEVIDVELKLRENVSGGEKR